MLCRQAIFQAPTKTKKVVVVVVHVDCNNGATVPLPNYRLCIFS